MSKSCQRQKNVFQIGHFTNMCQTWDTPLI